MALIRKARGKTTETLVIQYRTRTGLVLECNTDVLGQEPRHAGRSQEISDKIGGPIDLYEICVITNSDGETIHTRSTWILTATPTANN